MKTYTNNSPGLRGINTEDGMVWLEPGASASVDPKKVVGKVPDLGGDKPTAVTNDDDAVAALTTKVSDLEKQVADGAKTADDLKAANAKVSDLEKQVADQGKQIDELTKPAK